MLELTYLTIFLVALYFTKLGLIDRRAEIFSFSISMIFYAVFAFSSYNVQVFSGGTETVVQHPSLFILGVMMLMLSMVFTILSALDKLPEPERVFSYK